MGLTKRKDGWYVEFRVIEDGPALKLAEGSAGKLWRRKVGLCDKKQARNQEAIYKGKLLTGAVESQQAKRKQVTFERWAVHYLQIEEVLSIRTYRERCQRIRTVLMPSFGKKLLTAITVEDVEEWRRNRANDVEQATVNVDHNILRHMLTHAMRRDLLNKNVASLVAAPKPDNARNRVLDRAEWDKLYQAAPEWFKPVLLTALHTGMRLEEILGLEWAEVDVEKSRINLPASRTKTKKARTVPLTPAVRSLLKALRHQNGIARLSGLVFTKDGKQISHTYRTVQDICKATGIQNFRFHDLRHCAVTFMSEAGIPLEEVMASVGHASVEMYLRYRAVQPARLDAAMNQYESYLTR
jgi:integrase